MAASTQTVREHLDVLAAWDGADVATMPVDEALAAFEAGSRALHALQAVVGRFAARVDQVCELTPGMNGYARRHGHASGPALLAAAAGMGPGEANRLTDLGRGLLEADAAVEAADASPLELAPCDEPQGLPSPCAQSQGQPSPCAQSQGQPRPLAPGEYLARAVDSGRLGQAKAEVIRLTLADFTIDSREAEKEFVDYAGAVGLRKLKAHCFGRLGELDPKGLAIREERQRRERFLSVTDGADGMITIYGKLDVATGAPIKTLLDSMGAAALRRQRKLPRGERLSPGQLVADALSDVAQHALTCSKVQGRPKTTVIVRENYEDVVNDLREAGHVDERGVPTVRGRSLASCDGILQPITAGTARLMAVEAQIRPAVMGGGSLPMDMGHSKRLFTKAQTLAIAERDRGCIRCTAPPAFCHTHHIVFWSDDGPTDLLNGVLLCTSCHHRLHEQRWTLEPSGDRYVVRELSMESGLPPGREPTCPDRHPLLPVA